MERSILRLRTKPHIHPDRREETIVEVVRDGKVVATIYGTREGVQIVSDRIEQSRPPVYLDGQTLPVPVQSIVVPLLAKDEVCPWCQGTGVLPLGMHPGNPVLTACSLCRRTQ